MIKINNKKHENYTIEIEWGRFISNISGQKEEGISPIIRFIIDNKIMIGLELVYSIDKFKNLEINKKIDIKRFLSDVAYEDDEGWISIINDSVKLFLSRINKTNFHIDFEIKYNDFSEKYNAKINCDLKML